MTAFKHKPIDCVAEGVHVLAVTPLQQVATGQSNISGALYPEPEPPYFEIFTLQQLEDIFRDSLTIRAHWREPVLARPKIARINKLELVGIRLHYDIDLDPISVQADGDLFASFPRLKCVYAKSVKPAADGRTFTTDLSFVPDGALVSCYLMGGTTEAGNRWGLDAAYMKDGRIIYHDSDDLDGANLKDGVLTATARKAQSVERCPMNSTNLNITVLVLPDDERFYHFAGRDDNNYDPAYAEAALRYAN